MRTYVFVQNRDKTPLPPISPAAARRLLKERKVGTVRSVPFIVRHREQQSVPPHAPITIGLDTGSKYIGIAAAMGREVVFRATVDISHIGEGKDSIPKRLIARRSLRRGRRSRVRRRPARFDNRASSRRKMRKEQNAKHRVCKTGRVVKERKIVCPEEMHTRRERNKRLSPVMEAKLQAHMRVIAFVARLLPVQDIVIEMALFDTQKMVNANIEGLAYQHGTREGFEVREYLLHVWNHKCAYCGREFDNTPSGRFEVDHVFPQARGKDDRISNLVAACHQCNQAKGKKTAAEFGFPNLHKKAKRLKDTTVGVLRTRLRELCVERFGEPWTQETLGYMTRYKRMRMLNWEKSHANDAAAIALHFDDLEAWMSAEYGDEWEALFSKPREEKPDTSTVVPVNEQAYVLRLRRRSSRRLHDSMPTKAHQESKSDLKARIVQAFAKGHRIQKTEEGETHIAATIRQGLYEGWDATALQELIEQGVAEGWLVYNPNRPVPTKQEAKALYDLLPDYEIRRTRKGHNPDQRRRRSDSSKASPHCKGWNKGDIVVGEDGELLFVSGLDKNGTFRYRSATSGETPTGRERYSNTRVRRRYRRTGITAIPHRF